MVYIIVLRCLHERVMRQCYAVERQCYVVARQCCVVERQCYAIARQCCVVVQQCMAVLWCCAVVSTEKARQVQSTADVMLLQPLMREMLFRVAACGLVGSGFSGVFGVGSDGAGVGGTRRNSGRT